jgi:hypothetical protein
MLRVALHYIRDRRAGAVGSWQTHAVAEAAQLIKVRMMMPDRDG